MEESRVSLIPEDISRTDVSASTELGAQASERSAVKQRICAMEARSWNRGITLIISRATQCS